MLFKDQNKLSEVKIDGLIKEVRDWRRYFHENPELSYEEVNTSKYVFDTLQSFDNLIVTHPTKTSVMAILKGGKPGKVVAYRADMDALPIEEETELSFSSVNKGIMHACGHDGHTAMLLGFAKACTEIQEDIEGEVRFIFQHAEELLPGGAKELVENGVMKNVDHVIGLHLFTMLPTGKVAISPKYVMANSDVFEIEVIGKGGHASEPNETIDPIVIGSEIVSNLQQIKSRKLPTDDNSVISVTEIHGGTAQNIIPNTLKLGGGVRSFDQGIRTKIPEYMESIIKGITQAHSANYKFNFTYGYQAVYNNEELTKNIKLVLEDNLGSESLMDMPLFMGGEDFSAYLKDTPGCFIGIGAAPEDSAKVFPHHHPKFEIDEKSLEIGLKVLLSIVTGLQTN